MKKLKDVNWNHLYCFYEVGRAQSLKTAAKILGVAPSTASEQIKKLEESIETKLFTRSSKGLMLTSEGSKLFEHAREVFEAGSKLLDNFSDSDVGGYPVTVGIEETISYDVATEFTSQYWDVFTPFGTVNTSRELEHNLLVDSILEGRIDWGISIRPPRRKGLDFAEIGSFSLVFCCSKDLYEKFIDPKDIIRNIPLAQSSWDSGLNKTIEDYLRKHDVYPRETIYSDHLEFVKKLCKRGRCVMYTAENPLDVNEDIRKFQVGDPLKVVLYAIWNKTQENMLSIKKLKQLVAPQLGQVPSRYDDVDWQIEVSEVSDDLLK